MITINQQDFVKGIGSSSTTGMELVQNLDILNVDGTVQAGFETVNTCPDPTSTTFTADSTTDQLTVSSTFRYTREGITINATGRVVNVSGTLPSGLSAATNYFIIDVSSVVIKLASTLANAIAGTAIDITTNGSGTLTITSINPARFEHYALNPNAVGAELAGTSAVYAQDAGGRVWTYSMTYGWVLVNGNVPDGTVGAGLAIWKDYLFSFKQSSVDVYGPLASSPTWSNAWAGGTNITGGNAPLNRNYHTTFNAYNDKLYFANTVNSNTPCVGSLLEVPGKTFAPADATTYTWNARALDLPNSYFITDFDELGLTLYIGTVAYQILPWDFFSPSFGTPIVTAEQNVNCLKTVNNTLYYACGFRGNIYKTLGTTSALVNDFSDQLSNVPSSIIQIIDMQVYKGYILFSATGNTPGLYILDINNNNRYVLFNTCSNTSGIPGAIFTDFDTYISTLNYVMYRFFFSWGTTTGISGTNGCDSNFFLTYGPWRATGSIPYFISQLYRTQSDEMPYTFGTVSLYLNEPIPATHSVILQYRTDDSTAFSSANQTTFTSALMSDSGGVSATLTVNIEKSRIFQVKTILSLPANTSGTSQYTTPKLNEITFNES